MMLDAALIEAVFGINLEDKSLEQIANPSDGSSL